MAIRLLTVRDDVLLDAVSGAVERDVMRVWNRALRTAPERDGDLWKSQKFKVWTEGTRVRGWVYTAIPYAPYVHQGRGPVQARPGKVLGPLPSPYPRFVRRVRAAAAQPWLVDALKELLGDRYAIREND